MAPLSYACRAVLGSVLLMGVGCTDKAPERESTVETASEACIDTCDTLSYTDADGDGYFAETDDCDDADASVNAGQAEACDGVDNDCDGRIDEGLISSQYADLDGDGFGEEGTEEEHCTTEAGWADQNGDCDDADAAIYPGAAEACGDGIDQDCDAADTACVPAVGEVSADDAYAELMGEEEEYAGARVRPAGDMDGDGLADVWVNLYAWGPVDPDWRGVVMLVPGPIAGRSPLAHVETAALLGDAIHEYAGFALSRGEDLNGDGWPDVALGLSGRLDSGAGGGAAVVYGPVSGDLSVADADGLIVSDDSTLSQLGYGLSSSPDLTGDGVGDVVVSGYGSPADNYTGAVWIVAGPVDGTVALSSALVIRGDHEQDQAGHGLDGVGDLNGDGFAELVLSAPAEDTLDDDAGVVGVFWGPLVGDAVISDADLRLTGEFARDELGRDAVYGRGDVGGDGLDDLWIGAPFASPSGQYSGAAFLFSGDTTDAGARSAADATARIYGEHAHDQLATDLDIAGDPNADGYDDLVLGGSAVDSPRGTDAGAAYLFYGPLAGSYTLSDADAEFEGSASLDGFGTAVAGVGDTNGDGKDDILVGGWFNDDNGDYAGAAYLFSGG